MKKSIVVLLLLLLSSLTASAWEPTSGKPVTIIIAYSPGSANELLTRKAVSIINKKHNVNFVIELKPGAYELIGMNHFADAASDGYTLYSPGAGAYYGTPVCFKNKIKTNPLGCCIKIDFLV
jgi:tripartite-type tricarboxylate transporter receptor subunit TctC